MPGSQPFCGVITLSCDAMKSIRAVAILVTVFVAAAAVATGHEDSFHSTGCSIDLTFTHGWRIRTTRRSVKSELQCEIVLDPPNWSSVRAASQLSSPQHAITLLVYRRPFPEVAAKARFFLFEDGKWRIVGRGNDFPVSISTPCCFGMRGHLTAGQFRKDRAGGYQGLYAYDHAIIANREKTVVVSAAEGYADPFEQVLRTLRIQ
jgi:hypothetical protein